MEINTVNPREHKVIQGYGDGGFRISGLRHEGCVLIVPGQVLAWDPGEDGAIGLAGFVPLKDHPVDVLLIGTGPRRQDLPPALLRAIQQSLKVGIEVMDTGAACRTYNVLLAEMRPIAAALIAV